MIDNSKEYAICAAIWYDDGISEDNKEEMKFPAHGKGRTFTNDNISTGFVIGGHRHGNCIAVMPTNPKFNGGLETVQGFLTSKGRFVDRYQGMCLAFIAGQVDSKRAFKEDFDDSTFDYDKFIDEVPSDEHRNSPFWALYSEDLY